MKAHDSRKPGEPLSLADVPIPEPGPGQVRVKVRACGVCRTDLHVVDGDLANAKLPIIPGHEIVGIVDKLGDGAGRYRSGTAWESRGWVGRTANADTASAAARTYVIMRSSRAIR